MLALWLSKPCLRPPHKNIRPRIAHCVEEASSLFLRRGNTKAAFGFAEPRLRMPRLLGCRSMAPAKKSASMACALQKTLQKTLQKAHRL